jgi:lysophospholipase L1-like esterase
MRAAIAIGIVAFLCACGAGGSSDPAGPTPAPIDERPAPSPQDPTAPPQRASPTPAPTSTSAPTPGAMTVKQCFQNLTGKIAGPDYDKFGPKVGKHCSGTQHQQIAGVQKLVFLGDSITKGTPPSLPNQFYSQLVAGEVKKLFGQNVEVADCSAWGARTDDFLQGKKQIQQCFPSGVENKKTLVVMTMGGNDIANWSKNNMSTQQAMQAADDAATLLGDALRWLKDPQHFPAGSYVVFANVYEYTDTSGDLLSCPSAALAGMSGNWSQGAPAVVHFQEKYMELAVQTKTDMVFLLETFCGHGFKRDDPSLQCYRGPGAELWFDMTCIHPNPKGHVQIAKLFTDVIKG